MQHQKCFFLQSRCNSFVPLCLICLCSCFVFDPDLISVFLRTKTSKNLVSVVFQLFFLFYLTCGLRVCFRRALPGVPSIHDGSRIPFALLTCNLQGLMRYLPRLDALDVPVATIIAG